MDDVTPSTVKAVDVVAIMLSEMFAVTEATNGNQSYHIKWGKYHLTTILMVNLM